MNEGKKVSKKQLVDNMGNWILLLTANRQWGVAGFRFLSALVDWLISAAFHLHLFATHNALCIALLSYLHFLTYLGREKLLTNNTPRLLSLLNWKETYVNKHITYLRTEHKIMWDRRCDQLFLHFYMWLMCYVFIPHVYESYVIRSMSYAIIFVVQMHEYIVYIITY